MIFDNEQLITNNRRHRIAVVCAFVALVVAIPGGAIWAQTETSAEAKAELYFVTGVGSATPGTEVTVGLLLSASVSVNALAVEIGYSSQALEFVRANTGSSIIDVWRGSPEILRDGIVRIEGGMSRPFTGRAGELVQLTFRVRMERPGVFAGQTETAQWSVRSGELIRADGRGTLVPFIAKSASVAIVPGVAGAPAGIRDAEAPRLEMIAVVRNPVDLSHLGVWSATDAGSGIGKSEVRFKRWLLWGPWTIRENPVQVPPGVWAMDVRVTDNAGNASEGSAIRWDILLLKFGTLIALLYLAIHVIRWEIAHHPHRRVLQ